MRLLSRTPPEPICTCPTCEYIETEYPKRPLWQSIAFLVFIVGVCMFAGCDGTKAFAAEYTDTQIANAIRKAEGTWTYGIKTVKCETEVQCRQVCLNTVRANRKRFARYGHRQHPQFIQFLASRYCPTTGRNITQSEKRFNGNWIKNVSFFLERGA